MFLCCSMMSFVSLRRRLISTLMVSRLDSIVVTLSSNVFSLSSEVLVFICRILICCRNSSIHFLGTQPEKAGWLAQDDPELEFRLIKGCLRNYWPPRSTYYFHTRISSFCLLANMEKAGVLAIWSPFLHVGHFTGYMQGDSNVRSHQHTFLHLSLNLQASMCPIFQHL